MPLRESEIEELYNEFDHDKDGHVSFQELEETLRSIHEELAPNPKRHHLNHPARSKDGSRKTSNNEKTGHSAEQHPDSDLHDFLCGLMPGCGESVTKEEFFRQVRSWNIPSHEQASSSTDIEEARDYDRKLPFGRRITSWWSVNGPEAAFLTFVSALILAFSLWQGLIYATNGQARAALGGGVVAAKFSAGALYPTFFFLILSMSRWFATFCRKSYLVSRFINWDLSQSFHIRMSCVALVFSLTHAIAHMTGTFVYGSSANRQENLQRYLGASYVRRSYSDYIATRPGWTGLTAIGSFILIGLTSIPWFRKNHYEAFQLAHTLMYLMFAMLAMHGTAKLLQAPMMGYWLVFPVICVLLERIRRLYLTFFSHHSARLEALDDGTVVITAEKPEGQKWRARAGQYILLQVPTVSRFQWHPFTISACIGNRLQIHIKADGNWTDRLHKVAGAAKDGQDDDFAMIKVGIDGPFGAPAQRFYTFDKTIVVGSGIGVTPFSACLTDLEEKYKAKGDPWKLTRTRSFGRSRKQTRASSRPTSPHRVESAADSEVTVAERQSATEADTVEQVSTMSVRPKLDSGSFEVPRCDFHWSVREKNDLLWFSDLLNRAADLAETNQNITLNIRAHITAKRKKTSSHVFRYLLDGYRTKDFPYSALTGLKIRSEFGRPDYDAILTEYYEDMKQQGWHGKVGVFHCGPPIVGEMLADQCSQITLRAAAEGTGMRFMFHNEVFG